MTHEEGIRIKETVIEITPQDFDGEILYKIVFEHGQKDISHIMILKSIRSRLTPPQNQEYIEINGNEKEEFLKSFAPCRYPEHTREEELILKRNMPLFDVRLGLLRVRIINKGIFEAINK